MPQDTQWGLEVGAGMHAEPVQPQSPRASALSSTSECASLISDIAAPATPFGSRKGVITTCGMKTEMSTSDVKCTQLGSESLKDGGMRSSLPSAELLSPVLAVESPGNSHLLSSQDLHLE